jgi:hypothetical protein
MLQSASSLFGAGASGFGFGTAARRSLLRSYSSRIARARCAVLVRRARDVRCQLLHRYTKRLGCTPSPRGQTVAARRAQTQRHHE